MSCFEFLKGKLGFGCMRLPMIGNEVDEKEFSEMIDAYFDAGFNYFDTAHGYLDGKSEKAIRKCLTSRYPRESYILTDKLTNVFFNSTEDIRKVLLTELDATGAGYFDFFLMHSQTNLSYGHFRKYKAYEETFRLKDEGLVKHVGLSFHDKAELLDEILSEYPDLEVVQLQINYLDWEDPVIQSRKCYEVAKKHNKPVIVMEPVKGGHLAKLPVDAKKVLDSLGGGSEASYALRFAAGLDNVIMVLSGMSSMEQMNDNIRNMKDFKKLDKKELDAIEEVRGIFSSMNLIPCTACHYCTSECPKHIPIPDLFAVMNSKKTFSDMSSDWHYNVITANSGKPSDCIKCGKCENACPQHLEIRKLLETVAETFEKK